MQKLVRPLVNSCDRFLNYFGPGFNLALVGYVKDPTRAEILELYVALEQQIKVNIFVCPYLLTYLIWDMRTYVITS